MKKQALIITAALLIAGGAVWAFNRRGPDSDGPQAPDFEPLQPPPEQTSYTPPEPSYDPSAANWIDYWTTQNAAETWTNSMPTKTPPSPDANIKAMGDTIAKSEGTFNSGDPYRVCFGYKHTIIDFSDHPAITGEWRGEPLSAAMCKGAGLGPSCVSTAAGKYQIIKPTWLKLKAALKLPDFSSESQDRAMVELLRQRGALEFVKAGEFSKAVFAARKEWASLAGAGYGQGERSIEWLTAKFTESGGVLA